MYLKEVCQETTRINICPDASCLTCSDTGKVAAAIFAISHDLHPRVFVFNKIDIKIQPLDCYIVENSARFWI